MNLQVLVSTMHQNDYNLMDKMRLQSDSIVINQCERNEIVEFEYNGNEIKFYSFAERGVGLSRNNALMRATACICLFADDDMVYVDGYKDIIIKAFKENPRADVIVFNVISTDPNRQAYQNKKRRRIRWFNSLRYGTFRIAIRTDEIRKKNIYFSLLFGGGARYSAGEDVLFIITCLKRGLRIYAEPKLIGYVSHEDSTWFKGYTDKFFYDRGVLFSAISPMWAKVLCLQFAVRKRKLFKNDKGTKDAFKLMIQGTKELKGK